MINQELILYLKCDTLTGISDASGNNRTVTPSNTGVSKVTDDILGSCLDFDGTGHIKIDHDFFQNKENFTISLWVNPSVIDDGSYHGFIGRQGTPRSPAMWVTPSNSGLHFDSYAAPDNARYHAPFNNFFQSANKWVYVTWVKEGLLYKFYRDGVSFAVQGYCRQKP